MKYLGIAGIAMLLAGLVALTSSPGDSVNYYQEFTECSEALDRRIELYRDCQETLKLSIEDTLSCVEVLNEVLDPG